MKYEKQSVAKQMASKMSKKMGVKYVVVYDVDEFKYEVVSEAELEARVEAAKAAAEAEAAKQSQAKEGKAMKAKRSSSDQVVGVKYQFVKEDDKYVVVKDADDFKFSFGKSRVGYDVQEDGSVVVYMSEGYYAFHMESVAKKQAAKAAKAEEAGAE